jgi:hypothetical protein
MDNLFGSLLRHLGRIGDAGFHSFNWRDYSNMTTKNQRENDNDNRKKKKENGGEYFVIKEFHGRMREGGWLV